ncbi:hypothetical protein ABPG72_012752, partial [Tetrahymena utriculariae]
MIQEIQVFITQSLIFHRIDNITYETLLNMNPSQDGEQLLALFYKDQSLSQQQYLTEIMRLANQIQRERQSQNWYNQKQSETSQHNQQQIRKWTVTLALESLEAIAETSEKGKADFHQRLFLRKALVCLQCYLSITQFTFSDFKIYQVSSSISNGVMFTNEQLECWKIY